MNPYKLRAILDRVRKHSSLPRDQWDEILRADDLLVWFEVREELDPAERRIVERELELMTEAERFMERWNADRFSQEH